MLFGWKNRFGGAGGAGGSAISVLYRSLFCTSPILVPSSGSGVAVFDRAGTEATVTDWEGIVRNTKADEVRMPGHRKVENFVKVLNESTVDDGDCWSDNSTTVADQPDGVLVTGITASLSTTLKAQPVNTLYNEDIEGRTFVSRNAVKAVAGDETKTLTFYLNRRTGGGSPASIVTVTLTNEWQVISQEITGNTGNIGVYWSPISGTATQAYFKESQIEEATGQFNTNPSEYVSVGVESDPWHGVGVDGVKYSANLQNNNTVDANNVVSEVAATAGSTTVPQGLLMEPSATNLSDTDDDLTGGAETVSLPSTGDYTLSVYGTAAVTIAAGTATITGGAQATEGNPVTINCSATGTVTLTLDSGTLDTSQSGAAMKQLEDNAFVTTFIPASGGAATRNADSLYYTGITFPQTAGFALVNMEWPTGFDSNPSAGGIILGANNTGSNLLEYTTTAGQVETDDGTNQTTDTKTLTADADVVYAVSWSGSSANINNLFNGTWDTWATGTYDGGYPTDGNDRVYLAPSAGIPILFKGVLLSDTEKTTAEIESAYSSFACSEGP